MPFLRFLTLLLLATAIAGGANYVRNEPLDAELADRPYATISEAELNSLRRAYRAEAEDLRAWIAAEPQARPSATSASDMQGKLQDFERFQHEANEWRAQRSRLLEREVTLAKLQQERSIRDRGLHRPWRQVLRRVISF